MIPALINHLWQSTLFALGAGLLTLTLHRNGAGVRYGLWFAASVKFLIPFALLAQAGRMVVAWLHLWVAAPQGLATIAPMFEPLAPVPTMPAATAAVAAPLAPLPGLPQAVIPPHHAAALPLDPALILLGVWALGLAVVLLVWTVRWSRIRAALRAATPTNLPAPVPVLSTPLPMEPCVVGIRRPVLIVPDGIAGQLSSSEWKAILAHELCHIRRRDNLTGAIHMLVEALFWFHPLVWWLGTRLVAEREQACDEAVVRAGSESHIYAEGILKVCRLYLRQRLACAAGVSGANLKRRVQRILADPIGLRLSVPKKLLLAAAAVLSVATPVSAGLFASAPMAARVEAASAERDRLKPGARAGTRQALEAAASTETPVASQVPAPVALAAIETVLSPVPGVAHADSGDGQIVTSLSQVPPDLPAIAVATPAQPASAPAARATPPATQAVPADPKAQAASFVQSYAAVTMERHAIARWFNPLCVRIVGLAGAQEAAVKARILGVAKAVGARLPVSGCGGPNIEIGFTNDPQGMLDGVIKHAKRLLGDQTSGTSADKTVTRPIQSWYLTNGAAYAANRTDRSNTDGLKALVYDRGPRDDGRAGLKILVQQYMPPQTTGPFGPGYVAPTPGSDNPYGFDLVWPDNPRGNPGGPRQFVNVFVIIDLRSTGNESLALLTDYVAMLALSQPGSLDHCHALPSITDLYAGPCPGRAAPDGLTSADVAYLTALYARENAARSGEQTAVVARMAGILATIKVASR